VGLILVHINTLTDLPIADFGKKDKTIYSFGGNQT
jgi:hypothetical protein